MAEPVALAALALDAAIGWPAALYARVGHPVGGFARIIAWCEERWNRPERGAGFRRLLGVLTVLLLLAVAGGGGWIVQGAVLRWLGPQGWPLIALIAFPALAQRSLFAHVRPVARAGRRRPAARAPAGGHDRGPRYARSGRKRRRPCRDRKPGRKFCDGIAAPLFWLILLGLPGVWAYKAINTADSLIGHREDRWRAFGWAAARADDVLNLAPARIAGAILCIAGGGGWRTMMRDAGRHASPNAGWTEAAMAAHWACAWPARSPMT